MCPESNHGAPDPVVSSSLVTSIESSAITPTKSETLAKSEISPSGAVEVTKEVKELDALCECRNERIKEVRMNYLILFACLKQSDLTPSALFVSLNLHFST